MNEKQITQGRIVPIIGEGFFSKVLGISGSEVAKVIFRDPATYRHIFYDERLCRHYLEQEAKIGRELFLAGVSVPRPKGVFALRPSISYCVGDYGEPCLGLPALVMERIPSAVPLDKIPARSSLRKKVKRLADEEIQKARGLGFRAVDMHHPGNIIWSSEKEKAYLIDFGNWHKTIPD